MVSLWESASGKLNQSCLRMLQLHMLMKHECSQGLELKHPLKMDKPFQSSQSTWEHAARGKSIKKVNISFVPGLSFPKQPWPFIKTKGKLWRLRTFSSHGNLQTQDVFTGPDITYLQSLQLERHISCEWCFMIELRVENQVKNGKARSIWIHFWDTTYASKISSTGQKLQGLVVVLCQGKSSESEHSLPKRELQSFIPLCCEARALLPSPWLSLSMAVRSGHALIHGEEARHVRSVCSCPCQDTRGGSPVPCAKLWATENTLWGAAKVQTHRPLVNEMAGGNKQHFMRNFGLIL